MGLCRLESSRHSPRVWEGTPHGVLLSTFLSPWRGGKTAVWPVADANKTLVGGGSDKIALQASISVLGSLAGRSPRPFMGTDSYVEILGGTAISGLGGAKMPAYNPQARKGVGASLRRRGFNITLSWAMT